MLRSFLPFQNGGDTLDERIIDIDIGILELLNHSWVDECDQLVQMNVVGLLQKGVSR